LLTPSLRPQPAQRLERLAIQRSRLHGLEHRVLEVVLVRHQRMVAHQLTQPRGVFFALGELDIGAHPAAGGTADLEHRLGGLAAQGVEQRRERHHRLQCPPGPEAIVLGGGLQFGQLLGLTVEVDARRLHHQPFPDQVQGHLDAMRVPLAGSLGVEAVVGQQPLAECRHEGLLATRVELLEALEEAAHGVSSGYGLSQGQRYSFATRPRVSKSTPSAISRRRCSSAPP